MGVQVAIQPQSALVDEVLCICVHGLEAAQPVTLLCVTEDDGKTFYSYACYTADDGGRVHVSKMAATAGFYTGVEAMGLFWSMKPQPGQKKGARLLKKDVTTPLTFAIKVIDGHTDDALHFNVAVDSVLGQQVCYRWYLSNGVERIVVNETFLRGTLFIPKGYGPFPGVVDMFGAAGGTVEHRAALLASRGIAALALCYYEPGGDMIGHLEYFEAAVDYLASRPEVCSESIGTIGVSRGAEMSLYMGTLMPKVKASVAINGPWFSGVLDVTYKGETFSSPNYMVTGYLADLQQTEEGIVFKPKDLERYVKETVKSTVPVERSQNTQFLVMNCTDDNSVPPLTGYIIKDRMTQHGAGERCEALVYDGADHILEPPYSPLCYSSYNPVMGGVMVWGGEARLHNTAQVQAWTDVLNFLHKHLTVSQPQHITAKL